MNLMKTLLKPIMLNYMKNHYFETKFNQLIKIVLKYLICNWIN